jgi:hypothetical protein
MSVTGEARRPAVVTAAATMLAVGGVLFAGETYLAEERFFKASDIYGAVGELANLFHRLVEILGIFAGLAVALLAAPAFLGLSWARAVSWIFALPMLIWYGLTASLSALGRMVNGPENVDPQFRTVWPSWLDTLDTVLTATAAVVLIGALVGQTIPAADAYFRRRYREKVL